MAVKNWRYFSLQGCSDNNFRIINKYYYIYYLSLFSFYFSVSLCPSLSLFSISASLYLCQFLALLSFSLKYKKVVKNGNLKIITENSLILSLIFPLSVFIVLFLRFSIFLFLITFSLSNTSSLVTITMLVHTQKINPSFLISLSPLFLLFLLSYLFLLQPFSLFLFLYL